MMIDEIIETLSEKRKCAVTWSCTYDYLSNNYCYDLDGHHFCTFHEFIHYIRQEIEAN